MKKSYALIGLIVGIALIYGYVWFESYQNSKTFYAQAEENLSKKDYGVAIKGDEAYSEKTGKYEYVGGFEQVTNIWRSSWAWPRPGVYEDAKSKIDDIITKQLSPEEGMALVQMYMGQSNGYLPEILIESARKLIDQGRGDEAKDVITSLTEAFGSNPEVKKQAEELSALIKK